MIPKNLGELLNISAKRYPHRVAIVFGQKKITYKALDELTRRPCLKIVPERSSSGY